MKRAFMQPGNKPFDHLVCQEFKRVKLFKPILVYVIQIRGCLS
jgi:hypothetical protein